MATFSLQELRDEESVARAQEEGNLETIYGQAPEETPLEEQTVLFLLAKMAEGQKYKA